MRGAIIYNEEGLEKNRFFAEKLKAELETLGVTADIVTHLIGRPDFAVMRVYDEAISRALDGMGVRTFNNLKVASVCNDKWRTYLSLAEAGLPLAPTQRAEECTLPYPRIVKARHGHGGSEVFWTSDEREFRDALSAMTDSAIVQPPVGKRGRDLRVYVVGGEPIVAMLRKSETDFRSNFSLGGSAERYELSGEERRLVERVTELFDFDFAGIDFLLGEDGLICNEIEDVVGCRMVYAYTDVDIIKKYARHIVCSLTGVKTLENILPKY